MSHTLPTLSSLRVAEIDREFALWGVSLPTGWNVAEKKSYLKELRTAAGMIGDKNIICNFPKVKADLIEYCLSKGLKLTGNETVAHLTRKLKERELDLSARSGHRGTFGFGQHKNIPFLEIYEMDRPYCQWAVTTVLGSITAHPQMRRFAKYCDLKQEAEWTVLLDLDAADPDESERQTRSRTSKGMGKNSKQAPSRSRSEPASSAAFSSPMENEFDPSHEDELTNLAAQVHRVSQGNPLVAERFRHLLEPAPTGAAASASSQWGGLDARESRRSKLGIHCSVCPTSLTWICAPVLYLNKFPLYIVIIPTLILWVPV